MRVALLSDVHGNLAALRAVARAIDREEPVDHVVVAGDHLQGGPRPRQVWEMLSSRGWVLVRGNEDDALVVADPKAPPWPSPFQGAYLAQVAWTRERVGRVVLDEVAALPDRWRVPTPAGDLLVVHASPRAIDDRCGAPHNSLEEVRAAYGGTGAAAIAFGHYHRYFVRPTPFALLINVASVGLPAHGRPLAAYTILSATADGFIVEQREVPFRVAEETAAARANDMPPWSPDDA